MNTLSSVIDVRRIIEGANDFSDRLRQENPIASEEALQLAEEVCALAIAWQGRVSVNMPGQLTRSTASGRAANLDVSSELALANKARRRAFTVRQALKRFKNTESKSREAITRIELMLHSIATLFYRIEAGRLRELKHRHSFNYDSLRA